MFLAAIDAAGVLKSIGEIVVMLLIFAVILFLAYLASKLASRMQVKASSQGNLKLMETIRIQNNKYIQIVRVGEKYLVIGIGKDEITFLTELSKDALSYEDSEMKKGSSFVGTKAFDEILSKFSTRSSVQGSTGEDAVEGKDAKHNDEGE